MKTDRFNDVDTINKLAESLFKPDMDNVAWSNKPKRELSIEWLEWYVYGKGTPIFKYKTLEEFAFGLWPQYLDEKDNFFKDRRDDLIELVNSWRNSA